LLFTGFNGRVILADIEIDRLAMCEVCRFLLTIFKKSGGVLMHKLSRLLFRKYKTRTVSGSLGMDERRLSVSME
jgi:hypothetical protein